MNNIKIIKYNENHHDLEKEDFVFFNYLQSPLYCSLTNKKDRCQYLILNEEDQILMYFQGKINQIFGLIKYLQINRFGIMTKRFYQIFQNDEDIILFWKKFTKSLTKLHKIVIMTKSFSPLQNNLDIYFPRNTINFPFKLPIWGSAFIDLTENESNLFKKLNSKWRNMYRKSCKSGLSHEIISDLNKLKLFIKKYEVFAKDKNFTAVSSIDLYHLVKKSNKSNGYIKVLASYNSQKQLTGYIAIFISMDTATYFISVNFEEYKSFNSNYFLIWNALCLCKKYNLKYFDLGGITNSTPKGIRKFKEGLCGKNYRDLGIEIILYPQIRLGFKN